MLSFPEHLCFEAPDRQEAHQVQALQHLLPFLQKNSAFYREKLAAYPGESFHALSQLAGLPFTTKEDLQTRNWDFLCVPRHRIREYMTTSGTMGKPVTLALTESDLQRLAYNECQSFRCAEGHPEEVYQLALTLDRQFMAGMAYYRGIQKLGASLVRCGPGLPAMQWETIQRLGTTTLVAVPSFLLQMAAWAQAQGIDLNASSLNKAICIGESLRQADFSRSSLGSQLQALWPLKLYGTYASTEMQTAFTECGAGRGGHQQPELIVVEIVDDAGQVLPDGTSGEVVITTLGIEGMPLLRYRTGDVAALHAEPCSCGRNSKRLGPIVGRKGQMIKYRGTTLFPSAIYEVLQEAPYILGYVVEAYHNAQGTDEIRLHLHTSLEAQECSSALRSLLQARLRVAPALAFHTEAELQMMMQPEGIRKAVRFIDRRGA